MPIRTQSDLPAKEILEQENIFVMDESRAMHQDIRPINIVILNLMPLKEETELQIFRSLSNTPVTGRHRCFHTKIHAVNERLGNPVKIPLQGCLCASASVPVRIISAIAWIHRCQK